MNRKRPAFAVAILNVIILGVFLHAQNKPVIPGPFSPGTDGVGYPSCLSCPEPQYSEEALKAKFQGTISLSAVIGADGHATNMEVLTKRGLGLEEKAIAAVKWRFKPALGPGGTPVATITHIEVTFHMPQEVPANDCHPGGSVATDPVSSRLRQVFDCYSDGLIAQAEELPADKYTGQRILGATVGHNIAHVAFISDFACSKIAGIAAPSHVALANEAGDVRVDNEADKDKVIAWLKSSMDFCRQAFSKLSDAKLGEAVPWDEFTPGWTGDRGKRVTRFAAGLWVNNVLIERYGAFAGYLQAGGSLSAIDSVPSLPRAMQ